ncbi:MAG: helix-hairpin-helix domain-containing protein [Planctomycetota bacterium]
MEATKQKAVVRRQRAARVPEYQAEANWLAAATVVCVLVAGHFIYQLTNTSEPVMEPAQEVLQFTINVNEATAAQMQALPDIGPKLAQRIVDDREQNGPFLSIEGLTRVHGFGPQTLANLESMLTLGSPPLESAIQLAENRNP